MSIYKNIFHYYRGQSKKGSEETKLLQIENNATKAFLNVLQHSSPLLTMRFTNSLGLQNEDEEFEYMYQVTSELNRRTNLACVLGIADTKDLRHGESKTYNIPDGAILSESVSVLIETKIGLHSYLQPEQLEGHKKRFAIGQSVQDNPVLITWNEIRSFFRDQFSSFKEQGDALTCFFLKQFEEFCIINSIGEINKSKEYFFLHFEKVKAQQMAKIIDDYIWSNPNFEHVEDAQTADGIGYKKRNRPKFATLTIQRQRCLILHVGEKQRKWGLDIQKEIDEVLGRAYDRKHYEEDKYPHEAYIRLEWVDSFEQIKPFIDQAYELR